MNKLKEKNLCKYLGGNVTEVIMCNIKITKKIIYSNCGTEQISFRLEMFTLRLISFRDFLLVTFTSLFELSRFVENCGSETYSFEICHSYLFM